ncbi:MAG: ABC transporter permease subunit [Firmicutes bacterium]|nr:ABC transporter permease subunit [Candidatus Colimorpha enterica]
MSALYSKELKSYFTNMNGYIPISLILVMAGIFVKTLCFDYGNPNMEIALPYVNLILLIAIPILAMRSFSEEKHQKTEQLLYSLPLTTGQIVAAKYFAMMTVLLVPVAVLALIPFVLSLYGSVNFLMSFSALIGFYLLCGAMVATCMFMSSLTFRVSDHFRRAQRRRSYPALRFGYHLKQHSDRADRVLRFAYRSYRRLCGNNLRFHEELLDPPFGSGST